MTRVHTTCHSPAGHEAASPRAHRDSPARTLPFCGALLALLAKCPGVLAAEVLADLIQYPHTAWTATDGLHGRVLSIAQTSDGYLWLATENGLTRFDGVRFVASEAGAGPPLPSGEIYSLLASRDGTLWIGTLNGLVGWHKGKVIQYPELTGKAVVSLLEDHTGTLWAGGPGELCAIRQRTTQCSPVEGGGDRAVLFGDRGNVVYSLYEDTKRRLWAGTEFGLWQWTPGSPHRANALPITVRQALVQGDQGAELMAITGGADRALLQGGPEGMEQYRILGERPPFTAEALLRDHRGALWIGTVQDGLLRVQNGTVTQFSHENGLTGDFVSTLFEDREGVIWVGTIDGLDRFREPAVSTISTKQGLSTPVGCVLAARDGSVWIGSQLGLNRWTQGRMTLYRATPLPRSVAAREHKTGSGRAAALVIADPALRDNEITSLFEDQRGRIWAGTLNGGVAWFEHDRFTSVRGLPVGVASAIIADAHEGVWISYPDAGLFHVIDGRVVESVPWPWSQQEHSPQISTVVRDSLGGLWVGFLKGGIAYFKDGQIKTSLSHKDGLGSDRIWNLYLDHQGTLWAATEGGLSRIRDGRVTTLTTKNGLPCDAVHWLIEDDAFSFWVNTACGLLRVDQAELKAWLSDSAPSIHPIVFDRADEIATHASTPFSPVVTKSVDGRLWFVHWDGVTAIDPLHLPINRVVPPVHIEKIIADGKIHPPTAGLGLPARSRDLTIEYTALSLVAPEKVRFRFKLEGQDPDWREVVNVRHAEYSNLAPGSYRFRVLAANNSGVWNTEGAALEFSIASAYWQTNWFRALCGAAFMALVWTLYRLRLRHVAREFERGMDARVDERTRIARELHDTLLQSFNGLLLRFQTVLDLLPRRPAEAKDILSGAIDQANNAITEGRQAVEGLRSSTQESNDLVLAIRSLGEELAAGETVEYSGDFRVDVEGTPRPMHPIVRDEIYRIASEALRNAFHHSRCTKVEVEFHYNERDLRLQVRDNGKGIDAQALTDGGQAGHYGLRGMRERAELIGGTLTVWSAPDSGTEIEFSLPASLGYAAYPSPRPMGALRRWALRHHRRQS
jgi:signal transduction histidine kinase/ligand-binding sensor domain-containing protein